MFIEPIYKILRIKRLNWLFKATNETKLKKFRLNKWGNVYIHFLQAIKTEVGKN